MVNIQVVIRWVVGWYDLKSHSNGRFVADPYNKINYERGIFLLFPPWGPWFDCEYEIFLFASIIRNHSFLASCLHR